MSKQNPVWTPQPEGFFSQETTFQRSAETIQQPATHHHVVLKESETAALKKLQHKLKTLVTHMEVTKKTFKEVEHIVLELSNPKTMKSSHFQHGLGTMGVTLVNQIGRDVPTILATFHELHSNIFKAISPHVPDLAPAAVESITTAENTMFAQKMNSLTDESSRQTQHLHSMAHLKTAMLKENENLQRKMKDATNQFNTLTEQHTKQLSVMREQQQNTAKLYQNIAGNFMDLFEGHKRVWNDFIGKLENLLKNQNELDHKTLADMVTSHINKLNTLTLSLEEK